MYFYLVYPYSLYHSVAHFDRPWLIVAEMFEAKYVATASEYIHSFTKDRLLYLLICSHANTNTLLP